METEPADLTFLAPDPQELGDLLPGYHVESLIAVGGMGAVYRAVQTSLDRTVAIKILPKELGGDATFRSRFEIEAKAMALLNHPNLAGVYDFGNVDGLLYIVMEFVEGDSLYHYAYGQFLEPDDAIRMTRGICLGLAHAHENGVLHRDIKPSNILLDTKGLPKIVDFGLAQDIKMIPGADEEVFGTPHYTAPEVLGGPGVVDARADIFSVGVILHELLTGRVPARDPRSASAIVPCDPRLDGVVRKATHPNPDSRYRSAAEMAAELEMISQTPASHTLHTHQPVAWTPNRHHSTARMSKPVINHVTKTVTRPVTKYVTRPTTRLVARPSSGPGIGWVIFLLIVAVVALLVFKLAR